MSDLFLSEKDLITKVAAGDEESFRQLFLSYHQQLGIHIFRITNSKDLAEEVMQNIFLKIWMNREMLNDVQNFRAYLFVLSKHHTLNCLREKSREQIYNKAEESQVVQLSAVTNKTDDLYCTY